MGKRITNPDHLKNKILLCTYIFRSLPVQFLKQISANSVEWKSVYSTIKNLTRDGLINKKTALHGLTFIYLSKSGYKYVSESIFESPNPKLLYSYRSDRSSKGSVGEHTFMNFVFIWNWVKNHPEMFKQGIGIYEDSNLNNCKVKFSFAGKDVVISPDILIYLRDEKNQAFRKAIFVENDTGGETYSQIYQKFVEYAALAEKGLNHNLISQAQIYFVFRSEKRLQQLVSPNGLVKLFSYYNNSRKLKNVGIELILKAFDGQTLPLNLSIFQQFDQGQDLNLKDLILERRPEWKLLA